MKAEPFTTVTGVAAPLPLANVDTDAIMPKQFLKGIDRNGLRDGFLFDQRFEAPGKTRADFILNRAPWTEARFLVVGPNFGCGSSREHAVWGMSQLGIRAIFSTSFGGIFWDNCVRNGVPAIVLPQADIDTLMKLAADPARNVLTVDLPDQVITCVADSTRIRFEFDALRKDALVRGLDAVGATLDFANEIHAFERDYHAANPWLADR
jgi:3-isopropylmalate/(R)-2-methylmalate dehydratase small subunit